MAFRMNIAEKVEENKVTLFLPHWAPSWILSLAENLASSSLQDGATEWHYSGTGTTYPPSTHPPTVKKPMQREMTKLIIA